MSIFDLHTGCLNATHLIVQIIKKALDSKSNSLDMVIALYNYTPHRELDNQTPAKIFFGRNSRMPLDLFKPRITLDTDSQDHQHCEDSANEAKITNQTSQPLPESPTLTLIHPTCRTRKDIHYRQLGGIRPYIQKKATSTVEKILLRFSAYYVQFSSLDLSAM